MNGHIKQFRFSNGDYVMYDTYKCRILSIKLSRSDHVIYYEIELPAGTRYKIIESQLKPWTDNYIKFKCEHCGNQDVNEFSYFDVPVVVRSVQTIDIKFETSIDHYVCCNQCQYKQVIPHRVYG